MKTIFRNSATVILALLVFLTTNGFTIYLHHCACEQLTSATLLPGENCCEHHGPERSCCQEPSERCNTRNTHSSGCCSSQLVYVKISTDIDNNILQKVPRILPVELEVTVHSSHDLNEESFFIKRIIVEIPPLYSGKQLITHLHQLKLDPLIV